MDINHTMKILPFSVKSGITFWEVYAKIHEDKVLTGQLILGWVSRFGLKPVEVHAYFSPEGKVIVRAILDASKVEASVKEIERRLKEAEGVLDVKIYVSPIQGLGLPLSVRDLMVGDNRAVIVRDTVFSKLINCLKDVWGTAGCAIFYYTGREVGRELFETWSRAFRLKGRTLVEAMLHVARLFGLWEDFELTEYDERAKRATLKLYGNVECRHSRSEEPNSHFLRAIAEEVFSRALNARLKAEERRCIARGDPYCEIRMEPLLKGRT